MSRDFALKIKQLELWSKSTVAYKKKSCNNKYVCRWKDEISNVWAGVPSASFIFLWLKIIDYVKKPVGMLLELTVKVLVSWTVPKLRVAKY